MGLIFEISFGLIMILFLGGVGLGFEFFKNLPPIVWTLSMVALVLLGIYRSIKQLKLSSVQEKPVGILYSFISLILGFFIPYFLYSAITVTTKSIMLSSYVAPLVAVILLEILYFIITIIIEESKKPFKTFVIFNIAVFILVYVISIFTYHNWKKDILLAGVDNSYSYVVTEDISPRIEGTYNYSGTQNYDSVQFPYWLGTAVYPFDVFKEGEEVFPLNGTNETTKNNSLYCGGLFRDPNWYEQCILVCDAGQQTVGYIPKKFLKSSIEDLEEKIEMIKKNAIGCTFVDVNDGNKNVTQGGCYDRIVIEIKDEKTLDYVYGSYFFYVTKNGTGIQTDWEKNTIYEQKTCEYQILLDDSNNIIIDFDGKKYNLEIDELNNCINRIIVFKH